VVRNEGKPSDHFVYFCDGSVSYRYLYGTFSIV
jgi:hypothetical protein